LCTAASSAEIAAVGSGSGPNDVHRNHTLPSHRHVRRWNSDARAVDGQSQSGRGAGSMPLMTELRAVADINASANADG
jgi:hypothetical protein